MSSFHVMISHMVACLTAQSYEWSSLQSLPTTLSTHIVGIYQNKIHAIGGGNSANPYQKNDYTANISYNRDLHTISITDWVATDLSSTFPDPSFTYLGVSSQQYFTIGQYIYIMGARDWIGANTKVITGKLLVYNMESQQFLNTSSYTSSMPIALAANCITTDYTFIYSIGGQTLVPSTDIYGSTTMVFAANDTFITYHIQGYVIITQITFSKFQISDSSVFNYLN